MAKGSEQFSWKLFGDSPHVCWRCKRDLRVVDVAEERHVFPSQRYEFLCVDCKADDVEAMIQRTKHEMAALRPR